MDRKNYFKMYTDILKKFGRFESDGHYYTYMVWNTAPRDANPRTLSLSLFKFNNQGERTPVIENISTHRDMYYCVLGFTSK